MPDQPFTAAWLVMLLFASGGGLILFLLRREIAKHDECIRDHDGRLDDNERAVNAHRVEIARNYVPRDEMSHMFREVKDDIKNSKVELKEFIRATVGARDGRV